MRRKYYAHRELACQEPSSYLSTIADGMDQAKVRVPRLGRESKGITKQLDTSLEGVLFHGTLRCMDVYIVPHTCKGGSNVTIHCLNESLKRMQQAYKDAKMKWPGIWFLQLDNTTKENKNQFVLGWLQTLVDAGVFDEIYVSFLPVGHTHEDIDQRFSVISRALRRTAILSVQHLMVFLSQFFKVGVEAPKLDTTMFRHMMLLGLGLALGSLVPHAFGCMSHVMSMEGVRLKGCARRICSLGLQFS